MESDGTKDSGFHEGNASEFKNRPILPYTSEGAGLHAIGILVLRSLPAYNFLIATQFPGQALEPPGLTGLIRGAHDNC